MNSGFISGEHGVRLFTSARCASVSVLYVWVMMDMSSPHASAAA